MKIIRTLEEIHVIANYLKKEFDIKDLGKMKYCLGLQIEDNSNGIFIHHQLMLKRLSMDKYHFLSTPMIIRSLDCQKDSFRLVKDNEKIHGLEVPYMCAIGYYYYFIYI